MISKYVIGVDYGSDSCRILIAETNSGKEIAASVQYYPRWKEGKYCNPQSNQYRQHPLDYIESLEDGIRDALSELSQEIIDNIVGISFDTTGSTPCLINKDGVPLALLDQHKDNPNAMFVLWKDHTAIQVAGEINRLAQEWHTNYTIYEGGIYSSEWVWAKVAHVLKVDESIREEAYSWIEHCDWMPALLTGNTKPESVIRSRCAAGHKAMWHESWGGLPEENFLTTLSPFLSGFRDRLYAETHTSDKLVGTLTAEWASQLGLSQSVKVGVGALDCHMGAIGAEISSKTFVRVMGTSTCDVMVVDPAILKDKLIPGICGQVDGSVIPGMIGLEAGQSAFGDIYAWFRRVLEWPLKNVLAETDFLDKNMRDKLIETVSERIISKLSEQAMDIRLGENDLIANDWFNGRRTPYADQSLTGILSGLTLGTDAPQIFRALVEATAFGSKAIVDHFISNGIEVDKVIAIGGISQKSPLVMQVLSDVLGVPIETARTEQACALGGAMCAAVVAGEYASIEEAQKFMGQGVKKVYRPNMIHHEEYMKRYEKYRTL